jgi:D-amino-acid dehydrogenase
VAHPIRALERASRVEQISTDLFTLMSRGFDAFRPLVAGTPAQDVLEQRAYLAGYKDRKVFEGSRFSYDLRTRRGVPYEVIDEQRMVALDPVVAGRFSMGVYFPNAFWTRDPRAFTQTLLDDLVRKGGALRKAEAKSFVRQDGRVVRLVTTDGEVTARDFVIAAGPWSRGTAAAARDRCGHSMSSGGTARTCPRRASGSRCR